jgi:hypothetical protein
VVAEQVALALYVPPSQSVITGDVVLYAATSYVVTGVPSCTQLQDCPLVPAQDCVTLTTLDAVPRVNVNADDAVYVEPYAVSQGLCSLNEYVDDDVAEDDVLADVVPGYVVSQESFHT